MKQINISYIISLFLIIGGAVFGGKIIYDVYKNNIQTSDLKTNNVEIVEKEEILKDEINNNPSFVLDDSKFNFLAKAKEEFITDKKDFMEADLSNMTLSFWRDGKVLETVKILAKGKVGSWWETPVGVYKIEHKKDNHFSGFGHVYQPWSMVFQGNFFVHGWPYYPDGTPVSTTYSGGCIRLDTDDAKKIYDLASISTPLIVSSKQFISDNFQYPSSSSNINFPAIKSSSYLVADLNNNAILKASDINSQYEIGTISHLLAGSLIAEFFNLDKDIEIFSDAYNLEKEKRFTNGESVSAYNLLFPLLSESSKVAISSFANKIGSSYFTSLMNKKARSIGMQNTKTANLSSTTSTAEDLFLLGKYLKHNRSFLLKISSDNLKTSAYGEHQFEDLQNFNLFSGDDRFIGGQVFSNESGKESMLAIFDLPIGEIKRPIIIIVLDTESLKDDIINITNWINLRYK